MNSEPMIAFLEETVSVAAMFRFEDNEQLKCDHSGLSMPSLNVLKIYSLPCSFVLENSIFYDL